jgi:hypothetical protein
MNAVLTRPELAVDTMDCHHVSQDLRRKYHSIVDSDSMFDWCAITLTQWNDFAQHWGRLTLDQFMADGGTYRMRRYGAFESAMDRSLHLLAHTTYEQPLYINNLNGGVERVFDPLESSFVQHTVLRNILRVLLEIVSCAEGRETVWNIRLHPYRIVAKPGVPGQPTPEGLHRDGVDYIVTMMVDRHNVEGGESTFTDEKGIPKASVTLNRPMNFAIANDTRMLHSVTPVTPSDVHREAHRDVLVIAFTKVDHG